ncbi:hypothetical protein B0H14DRAFT_2306938, partial [Mycena olivaceomarginata]
GTASLRVYGGLLAAHSPVFHDILLPYEDAPTVDGCPVVPLSDAENILRCFLKALFDYQFLPPYPAETNFGTMSGIIRLRTKYQMDSLRKRALVRLSSAFHSPSDPTSFSPDPGSASWSIEDNRWIWIIVLGREMSIDWILPLALYRACAMCTVAQLLNGIEFDGRPVELSSSDKLLCIEQMISVVSSVSLTIIGFLWEPDSIPGCTAHDKSRCTNRRLLSR